MLDNLSFQARLSPILRQYYLWDNPDDESQRMQNVIEAGAIIPIYHHTITSEDVVILRGKAVELFYDNINNQ